SCGLVPMPGIVNARLATCAQRALISRKGRGSEVLFLSPDDAFASGLEVESQHYLDHTATNIVRGGKILIGGRNLTKSRAAEITHGRIRSGLATKLEVDVVESVQEFSPHLKVDCLGNLGLLDHADVKAGQVRPM